jgi:hypothetical protein
MAAREEQSHYSCSMMPNPAFALAGVGRATEVGVL